MLCSSRCSNYLDRIRFRPLFFFFKVAFFSAPPARVEVLNTFSARPLRIEVINTFTDRRLFDLDFSNTVSALKARIMAEFRLTHEAMKQRLLVADKRGLMNIQQPRLLEDARDLLEVVVEDGSSSLESCSIKQNETLCLGWKVPFVILVIDPRSGEEFPINFHYDETLSDLKDKIYKATGVPVTQNNFPFKLYHLKNSTLLLSSGYYSMQRDADKAPQHRIYLNRSNALRLGGIYFSTDEEKIPYDKDFATKMQIFVELVLPNFPIKLLPLFLGPTDVFEDIRSRISDLFPMHIYNFATCFEGERIGEDITMDEVGIKHMGSVQLFPRDPFKIGIVRISHQGNVEGSYTVNLRCFDTVGKLKEKIQDVAGVPIKEQRLKYDGWCLDDEKRSLEYYGIYWWWWREKNGCLLREKPEPDFKIHLHQDPTFNSESETRKCSANEVRLRYQREHIKLDPYSILPSSSLRGKALQIAVEVPHMQRKIPLDVNPRDSISTVIRAIVKQVNKMGGHARITKRAVVLAFGTKVILDESISLDEYGIKHTDSVQLLEKAPICFKAITVEHEQQTGGTCFVVKMRCFDTIGSLKEKLEVATGIPKEEQQVAYVQEPLKVHVFLDDDKRRFVDYGIHLVGKEWNPFGESPEIRVATSKEAIGHMFQW